MKVSDLLKAGLFIMALVLTVLFAGLISERYKVVHIQKELLQYDRALKIEEVEQEVEYLETYLRILWNKIKNNFESIKNTDNAAELMCIVMNAKNLAEESIQVAAVAEKFIQTIELKGVED